MELSSFDKNRLIEELRNLKERIYNSKKFGLHCEEEQGKANEIERRLFLNAMANINNAFIESQKWQEKHYCEAKLWDLVILDSIVCFVKNILTIGYNEGLDTFDYRLELKGVFAGKEFLFDCGYYDRGMFLI